MKTYVLTSGIIFALLALLHVWRIVAEGTHLLANVWWVGITVGAVALAVWAWRLLRVAKRP